jgi:hypothetical protein
VALLYAVRSRFIGTEAAEAEWNRWYHGHLEVLMGVNGFRAAQRFRTAASPDERPYLALYELESADVFTSPEYLKVWGFSNWRDQIDNWTRDLFELHRGSDLDFGTNRTERLRAAFLLPADLPVEQRSEWLAQQSAGVRGAITCGLDRSCAAVAWLRGSSGQVPEPLAGWAGEPVVQAVYAPLTSCFTR